MGKAMKSFPVMFRKWITKHVCGFCGCNEHLSHYTPGLINVCPACNTPHETTAHVTICTDSERTKLYKDSVDALVDWMEKNDTAPLLSMMIENYLRARGSRSMADVAPPSLDVNYKIFVKYHDILGWQNFIEGRFLSYMVHIQREHLQDLETWRTAETWSRGLIEQLLRITHRYWLLRNALIHYQLPGGRTVAQREHIVQHIFELVLTDPDSLLPEDRTLLDENFDKLGAADASDQAYWIAEMESALQAATHSERESLQENRQRDPTVDANRPTTHTPVIANGAPMIDTEGSIRHRRRKK